MVLVAERCGGHEEEGAGDDGDDEGEAEEEEGGARYGVPVPGTEGGLVGAGAEFFGLECWHCDEGFWISRDYFVGFWCGAWVMCGIWRMRKASAVA